MTNKCNLIRLIALGWLAALASGGARAQDGVSGPGGIPVQSVAMTKRAVVYPGLVYSQPSGNTPLTLDLYRPVPGRHDQKYPLIVFIHGGSWLVGDSRTQEGVNDFPMALARLAEQGFVVASVNYRLLGEGDYIAAQRDVFASIRWLRYNATRFAIDPDRVATWGTSAGGQLAGMAATACQAPQFDPTAPLPAGSINVDGLPDRTNPLAYLAEVSSCVQASIAWYGVFDFDLLKYGPKRPPDAPKIVYAYLGCAGRACADAEKLASPINYVSAESAPMLLIHGDADSAVPVSQTIEMAAKLKANGIAAKAVILPGADHLFIGADDATTRKQNAQAWSATVDFLTSNLKNRRPK